ncbi:MAG: hypothetical protein A3J07_02950 [Candidatus Doudnabacteria bacterium RIFCSPLOWO2_02_FULL_49_13]|nr:MAG: hypothetical protein A3B77_01755 [Candidatus Doudnabacteria bacterium RIFCSPHIGHO2_02_FULL_49_24]OGE89465.1 MAG: hypothetical protein A2760_02520 [Candidatus Doudnabacteria bacterium RIFCSPHIGHO2_01_FULL_50_67]OGF03025.1 MAG: hypothetical protein A3J07_02950 [Candidatus Doudnabacteria bacterium RIFCSPLOWO2_02_FULL_49_13]
MENSKNPSETEIDKKKTLDKWEVVGFAWELGYIIALPLVIFALAGKWADARMANDTPWITLIGIFLAIGLTTVWLTQRLKKYIKK